MITDQRLDELVVRLKQLKNNRAMPNEATEEDCEALLDEVLKLRPRYHLEPIPLDSKILGGMRIKHGWPCCATDLISLAACEAGEAKFVLVSNPDYKGSVLRSHADGSHLWTEAQIREFMGKWDGTVLLGQFGGRR